MNCIKCGRETQVLTTYQNANGTTRRRRECNHCELRFTTREFPEGHENVQHSIELNEKPGGYKDED